MEWFTKYRMEFKDLLGLGWQVDIQEYVAEQGTITTMQPTGNPLNIDWLSNSDNLFDSTVNGSVATINVYANTDFEWADLYNYDQLTYRVRVSYTGGLTYWYGYINSEGYTEPYDGVAYPVVITASDGLGFLKTIKYDDNGTPYNGRITEKQIIFDVLGKVNIETYLEGLNIYETNMDTDDFDSPLAQTLIDVDVFRDMYCYDVLSAILQKYNAVIRQIPHSNNGTAFIIYRPVDLVNSTIQTRVFNINDEPGVIITRILSTDQLIDRNGNSDIHVSNGGVMMIRPPVKKVTIKQDYGNKESWLDNYEVKGNTWIGNTFQYWNNPTGGINQLSQWIPGETDGLALPSEPAPARVWSVNQTFECKASAGDILGFEFDYLLYNFWGSVAEDMEFYVSVKSNTTVGGVYQWLSEVDDEYAEWVGTETFITIHEDVDLGTTGWVTYRRKIIGLPVGGTYTVTLYGVTGGTDNVLVGYKNIKIYATADEIASKKVLTQYGWPYRWLGWLVNAVFGKTYHREKELTDLVEIVQNEYIPTSAVSHGIENTYNYILGDVTDATIDNVLYQFRGSTQEASTSGYTTNWNTISPSGENSPLLEIVGDELQNQGSRPKQLLSLPIIEFASDNTLPNVSLVGNFQDTLNQSSSGINRIFAFNRGTFNVRDREWNIDLLEIIR